MPVLVGVGAQLHQALGEAILLRIPHPTRQRLQQRHAVRAELPALATLAADPVAEFEPVCGDKPLTGCFVRSNPDTGGSYIDFGSSIGTI
ncbi:hypothetical protein Areg01_74340 [Actinoplanes regularis]|nr:hypothetical protein Areg01_74340 [Actinoplanes regularis]